MILNDIMLMNIMLFMDRRNEVERLDRLAGSPEGGLAVVYGRRRVGKTRLLLEWCAAHGGIYAVADQSAAPVQRRYLAEHVAGRFPGFADVEYRDWGTLLARLAAESTAAGWRGPFVLDELPYLIQASPELPSILQRWIDHEARKARLAVALAGSSQRMMQDLVLGPAQPLYGRAQEVLEIAPLEPVHLREALRLDSDRDAAEAWAAWGGIPRYWELAASAPPGIRRAIEALVLDPLGPLHHEPDRLLLEEVPPAVEVRPVLDAIGSGAHRVSEIAGRLGRPATSMARPLDRLIGLGLVRREVPFGEPESRSKRSLYRIADPFLRLWFRVVAPNRGRLASGTPAQRRELLDRHWPGLVASAWEELCRMRLGRVRASAPLHRLGPFGPASRWWHGDAPEWDLVAESLDGRRLLLGEIKWSVRPLSRERIDAEARALASKPPPALAEPAQRREVVRALFVPEIARGTGRNPSGVIVVTAADILRA